MQAIGRQPQRAPDGAPVHYERHRPEQTTLYRLVQQHAASFIAHTVARTGAELPWFIRDEFEDFLECGILAHGFLRLRRGECGHDKLPAFSCKRRSTAKCHWKIGVEVDTLVLDVLPGSSAILGLSLLVAAQQGVFDAAELTLYRPFMPAYGNTAQGAAFMFVGRVAEIYTGRSLATFTVSSHLES